LCHQRGPLIPGPSSGSVLRTAEKLRVASGQRAEALARVAVFAAADQFTRGKSSKEPVSAPGAPARDIWGEDPVVLHMPLAALRGAQGYCCNDQRYGEFLIWALCCD
jgi:hypothetical protein